MTTTVGKPPERLYSLEEVAGHLKLNVRTIKRFVAAGHLQVVRFGRTPRVTSTELSRFLCEGTGPKQPRREPIKRAQPQLDRAAIFELARQTAAPKGRIKKSRGDPQK